MTVPTKKKPAAKRVRRKPPRTTCEQCGADLPEISIKHEDPFCTTGCAKTAHGVVDKATLAY